MERNLDNKEEGYLKEEPVNSVGLGAYMPKTIYEWVLGIVLMAIGSLFLIYYESVDRRMAEIREERSYYKHQFDSMLVVSKLEADRRYYAEHEEKRRLDSLIRALEKAKDRLNRYE